MIDEKLNASQANKLTETYDKSSAKVKGAIKTAQENYEKGIKQASDGLNNVASQTIKTAENLTIAQKESNQIFGEIAKLIKKSCDGASKDALNSCQSLTELQLNAYRDSLNAKNIQDLVNIHSKITNVIYNDCLANANKICNETYDTINKINQHYTKLFQQVSNKK